MLRLLPSRTQRLTCLPQQFMDSLNTAQRRQLMVLLAPDFSISLLLDLQTKEVAPKCTTVRHECTTVLSSNKSSVNQTHLFVNNCLALIWDHLQCSCRKQDVQLFLPNPITFLLMHSLNSQKHRLGACAAKTRFPVSSQIRFFQPVHFFFFFSGAQWDQLLSRRSHHEESACGLFLL